MKRQVGRDYSWLWLCTLLAGMIWAGSALSQADSPANTDKADIRAAVEALVDDFLNVRMIRPFEPEMSLEEAYHWQDEVVEMLRPTFGELTGYKTGGHNPGSSSPYFPPGGIRAQMLSGMFLSNGAAIHLNDMGAESFLEADFALRVGSESINQAQTDLEILAALDAFIPFAEVPDPTAAPDDNAMVRAVVGNMTSRIALAGDAVPIDPTEEWLERLNNMEYAVLDENNSVIERRSMADWYRPIDAVRWLRDHLQSYGKNLAPGQLLSLGNLGMNRPFFEGTSRGEVYIGNQYRVEYYGLTADGEPATVTINIMR